MLTALKSSLEHPHNDVLRPDFFEKKCTYLKQAFGTPEGFVNLMTK